MSVDEIKETGGARIGMAHATWPFATLTVNKDRLEVNAGIIGDLVFGPSDIISIELYSELISQGIKINHRVSNYAQNVIFLTSGAGNLINEIRQTGFLYNNDAMPVRRDITSMQTSGGFPLRWPPIIGIVVIWNALFMVNMYNLISGNKAPVLGIYAKLALGFIFVIALLLLLSKSVQNFMLKKGRSIKVVRPFLLFTIFVTGMMLLMTSLLP
jgi:hypothetical protein